MEQRGDLGDVGDGANDPHGPVAAPADGDIDGEHARESAGWVALPCALGRKLPNAGREWPWQWVFPQGERI